MKIGAKRAAATIGSAIVGNHSIDVNGGINGGSQDWGLVKREVDQGCKGREEGWKEKG